MRAANIRRSSDLMVHNLDSNLKRLALVCQHFYPEMTSTGLLMTELALRLQEMGWEITVYCDRPAYAVGSDEVLPSSTTYQGIRIERVAALGAHRKGMVSRAVRAISYLTSTLGKLVRDRGRYDGLLTTTNPPFAGLVGWCMAAWYGKPYVQLVHDVYPDIAVRLGVLKQGGVLARLWEQMSRVMLNRAAGTIVIGDDMAEVVRQKLNRDSWNAMHMIPNWSNEAGVQPVRRSDNPFRRKHEIGNQVLVQYAGRHGATHNLEPLIHAAEKMTDQPVVFQFVGEGAKKEKLQRMAQERALDNVMFLPYQPLDELDTVLSAADLAVVCLESKFTGLSVPSKTYGIMAGGTPILGFLDTESEIGRTIQENECGVVLEGATGDQVARLLQHLLQEPGQLEGMGERGRQVFEAKYTLGHAAARYDQVLQQHIYGVAGPSLSASNDFYPRRTEEASWDVQL